MSRAFKFVTLALLVAAGISVPSVSMMPLDTPQERPAGCHDHGQSAPRRPVSYTCCVVGHDYAMPQSSLTPKLACAAAPSFVCTTLVIPAGYHTPHDFALLARSGDPPGISPLRI